MTLEMTEDASAAPSYEPISEDGCLQKLVLQPGTGEMPPKGSKVSVHYTGTLLTGEKFDSSVDRNERFQFTLGRGEVIKGWDQGVATMRVGEKSILLCPAEYAYGERGSPPKIPANATLKFEVELFDFEEPADTIAKKLEFAAKFKEEGNVAFKSQEWDKALAAYEKALSYLNDTWLATEEEKPRIQQFKQALHGNKAASQLKCNDARGAIASCKEVLSLDPQNGKALFRMGQAYVKMGETEEAKSVLQKALELAPEDAAIKNELLVVKKKELELKQKEKQMFGKMFA